MAATHHKPLHAENHHDNAFCERRYKVGYRPNRGRPDPLPQLTIKGRWLERAGFRTGQPVTVTVEHGRLVIQTAGTE